jgi:hypothetical protein
MIVPTSQLTDLVRTLTKTASSVGQPYRCAMIDYSPMIFGLSQLRNPPIRDLLQAPNHKSHPHTLPENPQSPPFATTRD